MAYSVKEIKAIGNFLYATMRGQRNQKPKTEKFQLVPPAEIDYDVLGDEEDEYRSGEFILNPEVAEVDWEAALQAGKIKIIKVPAKTIVEAAEWLKSQSEYQLPDLSFWQHLSENYNDETKIKSLPDGQAFFDELKGHYVYSFGSLFRGGTGKWRVLALGWRIGELLPPFESRRARIYPSVLSDWYGGRLLRGGNVLKGDWDEDDRAFVLEK